MKIVCEACQAKYSISDDKVRGKVFKIRCKKCSHVIVVRGSDDAGSPLAAAPAGMASGAESDVSSADASALWHVVIDGEQVGPLSESDIRGRAARGEISGDTFIWKEGMSDWVKLSAVPELSGGAAAPASATYDPSDVFSLPAEPAAPAPSYAMSQPDPFAAAPAPSSASAGASDLFGSPVASSAQPGRSFTPMESPRAEPGARPAANGNGSANGSPYVGNLTGQRHENSVLFSLSNLEALAKPTPASSSPGMSSSASGSSSRGGFGSSAASEGSGLIDIRAMAATTLGSGGASDPLSSPMGSDLPAFGASQFSPVAPVLMPMSGSSGTPKWVWGLLGGLAVLIVVVGVAVIKMATPPPPPPVVAQAPVAAPAPPVAAAPTTPPETPKPAKEEAEALPPRETPPKAETEAAERAPARPGRKRPGKPEGSKEAAAVAAVAPVATKEAEKPAEKPKSGGGGLDELLDRALSTGGSRPSAKAKPVEEEPKAEKSLGTLSREDIVRGLSGVGPKTKECFKQYKVPGQVDVTIQVAKTGRVSDVEVTGKFAGTPSGGCVADAVRGAKFVPNDGTKIPKYPIFLR